ncbi:MAG: hypothetical protein ACE5FL_00810 [Myxococcota bacterium]
MSPDGSAEGGPWAAESGGVDATAPGPGPPLAPFGLVLHHDGHWSHESEPVRNCKLRSLFDRSVRYLPVEGKFVVQVQRFRGEIEVEEAGFFVRSFDPETGALSLSDHSEEVLDVASLHSSGRDGALLCRVKRALVPEGLLARFHHAAQAELLNAVEDGAGSPVLCMAGTRQPLPDL